MAEQYVFGNGLKTTDLTSGTLVEVDTANGPSDDTFLPISGAGLQSIVDDITTILQSI